jgi:hypothetical protein
MGVQGEDISLSPFARRIIPYSIECKSRAQISVYGFYEQAQKNCKGLEPICVVKQNRCKPLVVVDAEHFFNLIAERNKQ